MMRGKKARPSLSICYIIVALILIGIFLISMFNFLTGIRGETALNWGILLPRNYQLIYGTDTGPSFFGDGHFYHVLHYKRGINGSFIVDFSNEKSADIEDKLMNILGYLDVDSTYMIDFNETYYWKEVTSSPTGHEEIITKALYLLYQPDKKHLYIVRFKI